MKKYVNGEYIEITEEETSKIIIGRKEYEAHKYDGMTYSEVVVLFIREQYTIDDELAIHRQKDIKADEWDIYNAYCEDCKARAREIVGYEQIDEVIE